MHPELFNLPFTELSVKSYGLMMVIGFLAAVFLIRRLSRNMGHNPDHITNAALYTLIAGVVGARLFYVLHHIDQFRGQTMSIFSIWQGGLELLGGVVLAIAGIVLYLLWQKLPAKKYLDILAIGLMVALGFGRIGCFLNGCCFGAPTDLPWAVRFPYGSLAFQNQVYPNYKRAGSKPQLELPAEYYGYLESNGDWIAAEESNKLLANLKPYYLLTEQQRYDVTKGPYRPLPVHPTQLYSSSVGFILCVLFYLFWRRSQSSGSSLQPAKRLTKPGCIFALMFIAYGISRFLIEFVRDDNPFEFAHITISQIISVPMVIFGVALIVIFAKAPPDRAIPKRPNKPN